MNESIIKLDDTTAQIESVQTIREVINVYELTALRAREVQRMAELAKIINDISGQVAIMDEKLAKAASVGVTTEAPAPTE